jgi:predicted DNA-binding ribbon-helix-helix protein
MKSPISKRSIVIAGRKTSMSLEDEFWTSLKQIAKSNTTTLCDLIAGIDGQRAQYNLSSAARLFVLGHFKGRMAAAQVLPHSSAAVTSALQSAVRYR